VLLPASLRHPSSADCVPSALLRALVRIQQSFCLSDPTLPDAPIVHASDAFLEMTGYPASEVVGRNCRFLQGPGTDRAAVARLRAAIDAGQPTTQLLLNYTRAGVPFWNSVHVAPVRDASGAIVLLVGVQLDCTLRVPDSPAPPGGPPRLPPHLSAAPSEPSGVPADVAQLGVVGAVRVAVRGLRSDGLKRHPPGH
jgi:PAS domain S-box-containing protein